MSDTPHHAAQPTEHFARAGTADLPLFLDDQRRRWRLGQRALVESYVERHPALVGNPEHLLDLIYNEVVLREKAGETPRLEEYLGRFPHLADRLKEQFALDEVLWSRCRPAPPPAGAADLPRIAGYEVLGLLGRGGMGAVYRARHLALKRPVALKMLPAGAADPEQLARFRAEAEAAARLHHPNIVQIYAVEEHDGRPLLALEYVDGGSLADRLDGTPRPPAAAARLVATLARAMHYAHEHGVVHRDLKPANILLNDESGPGPDSAFRVPRSSFSPKISDFGLAKQLDTDQGQTRTGAILGTPSYMAPEQAQGRPGGVGPAADVYALGAILYEMLTGRPPFKAATLLETLEEVRTREPLAPGRLQPRLPRDLETICLKCLEKDPPKRYGTARELADELERFLRQEPIRARPVGPLVRLGRWCRRNPRVAGLLGLLATVLLAGIASTTVLWRRAEFQRQQAAANQEAAEAGFRETFDAVDHYYTQVSENQLLRAPGMKSLRRQLLTDARQFYDRFAARREGDPRVQRERALAVLRLARISQELDGPARAVDAWKQALEACTALARAQPEQPLHPSLVAECYTCLGQVYRGLEEWTRVEEAELRARDLWQKLARDHPDFGHPLANAALCDGELGTAYHALARPREAEEALQRSLEAQQEQARQRPGDPGCLHEVGISSFRLAESHRLSRVLDRAEGEYRQAITTWERLLESPGAHPTAGRDLAAAWASLGLLCMDTGRPAEAEESLRKAEATWQKLLRDEPDVPEYRRDLAAVWHDLTLLLRKARPAEAEALAQQALQVRRELVRIQPGDFHYLLDLAVSYRFLAVLANDRGRSEAVIDWNDQALRTAEEILRLRADQRQARDLVAQAAGGRAQILARQGEHAAALPDWDKALAHDGGGPRRHLLRTYRAVSLAHVGEHARAAADAAAVLLEQPKDPSLLCDLARAYALSAAAALRDECLPAADRPAHAERYAAQAVALLGRAREARYFEDREALDDLRQSADWQALRSRADFGQLLEGPGPDDQR